VITTETPLPEAAAAVPQAGVETPAPVTAAPADEAAPAVPRQQPPLAAEGPVQDDAPDAEAATTDTLVKIKAPPGVLWQEPAAVPAEAEAGQPVPVATASGPQAAPAQTAAAAEAAPAVAQQASAQPVPEPGSPSGPSTATPVVEPKAHGHTSTDREQHDQAPAAPDPKPQAAEAAETAKPAAPDQAHVRAPKAPLSPEARTMTPVDATAQPQPVATTAPQPAVITERTAATETPVRAHSSLAQLVETARTVVRMAVRQGATEAHITLHPAELGEVSIRLRYHAGGVSADVLAESHTAAQALQGAASELRRSLEAQGLVVHELDVRAGEHEKHRAHEQHGDTHGGHRGHRHAHTFDLPDQTTIDTSSLPLPTGAVDVLA
jgi:flagellar hook-length control protein FliK